MAADQISERHVHHMVQHHFGNPRQIVTDLHQWQGFPYLRGGHSQYVGFLEVPQSLHLLLEILVGNPQHLLTQVILKFGFCRRAVQALCVQQLVEQQGRFRQLARDPGAFTAQADQLGPGSRILQQQHHVGGSAQNRFNQLKNPHQRLGRPLHVSKRFQQYRYELV